MAKIHFLNVGEGDCCIIEHNNGNRVTMIDICGGNKSDDTVAYDGLLKIAGVATESDGGGNYRMAEYATKPQTYLREVNIQRIWRFVLSHPDMDHMDGFNALMDEFPVDHFWHMGAEREKPGFGTYGRYKEEDWDRYVKVRDHKEAGTKTIHVVAGDKFKFANRESDGSSGGDGLTILAPTKELVERAQATGDFNDCSYVLLYSTANHKIIFAGDSHDETWDHILANHRGLVANCDVLIAPHHGRKSGRSWKFLDVLKPKLTLFGTAKSEHLAYGAWNGRGLEFITNNQAGNVVLEVAHSGDLDVYVENAAFAAKRAPTLSTMTNGQNYRMVTYISSKAGATVG
jgi:competence protein ComEC